MTPEKADEYFCAHIAGLIQTVKRRNYPVFTSFLDLHQQALAEQVCIREHFHAYRLEGVAEDAERKVLGFAPSYQQPDELFFPIAVLEIIWPSRFTLTHRDLLGSLMALGIKREILGDMIVTEGKAELLVLEHLAEMICRDVVKIGRVGVSIRQIEQMTLSQQKRFQLIEGTVSSLRADALVSLATRLARGKAVELIRESRVQIDGLMVTSASQAVKPGQRLSIRGFGKFQLMEEIGTTRRERLHVVIRKYI